MLISESYGARLEVLRKIKKACEKNDMVIPEGALELFLNSLEYIGPEYTSQ